MITHLYSSFTFIIPATNSGITSEHADRHHTHSECDCGHYHLPWVSGTELPMSFKYVSKCHKSVLYQSKLQNIMTMLILALAVQMNSCK